MWGQRKHGSLKSHRVKNTQNKITSHAFSWDSSLESHAQLGVRRHQPNQPTHLFNHFIFSMGGVDINNKWVLPMCVNSFWNIGAQATLIQSGTTLCIMSMGGCVVGNCAGHWWPGGASLPINKRGQPWSAMASTMKSEDGYGACHLMPRVQHAWLVCVAPMPSRTTAAPLRT